jgi:multidrug efflux pump subunit AcrA (membrane-fusion protein)
LILLYKIPPQIIIPIAAVREENGVSKVAVRDAVTKKNQDITVTTGATTENNVVITHGLQPGMQVMVPTPTPSSDSKIND